MTATENPPAGFSFLVREDSAPAVPPLAQALAALLGRLDAAEAAAVAGPAARHLLDALCRARPENAEERRLLGQALEALAGRLSASDAAAWCRICSRKPQRNPSSRSLAANVFFCASSQDAAKARLMVA